MIVNGVNTGFVTANNLNAEAPNITLINQNKDMDTNNLNNTNSSKHLNIDTPNVTVNNQNKEIGVIN